MSDTVTSKLVGVEDLMSNIKKLAIASPTAVMKGVKRVALKIEREAKANCPVDTGRLRASITTNWTGSELEVGEVHTPSKVKDTNRAGQPSKPLTDADLIGRPSERKDTFTAVTGTNVEYAEHVEMNDSADHKSGAAHFLFGAYFRHEDEVSKEIASELGKEMAKTFKKK